MTESISSPANATEESNEPFPTLDDPTLEKSIDIQRLDHLQANINIPLGSNPEEPSTVASKNDEAWNGYFDGFKHQKDILAEESIRIAEENNKPWDEVQYLSDYTGHSAEVVERNLERARLTVERDQIKRFLRENPRVNQHIKENSLFGVRLPDLRIIRDNLPEEKEGSIVPVPLDIERAEALVRNMLIGQVENGQVVNKALLKLKDFFGKSKEPTRLDKAFQNVDNIFEDLANDQRAKIPAAVRNKIINNTEGNFDTDEILEKVGKSVSKKPKFIKLSKKEKEELVSDFIKKYGEKVGNALAWGLLKLIEDPLQDKRFKKENKNVELDKFLGDPVVDFLNNGKKEKSARDDAHLKFKKSSNATNSNSNELEADSPPKRKKKKNKK